jgi:hypothetical protein
VNTAGAPTHVVGGILLFQLRAQFGSNALFGVSVSSPLPINDNSKSAFNVNTLQTNSVSDKRAQSRVKL